MADHSDSTTSQPPIEFVKATGSPVLVGHRDRAARIREAMVDLQLVIDGCLAQPPDRFSAAVASLARHSSIFLRKMVLGDDRDPRLLDQDLCRVAELGFDKIRRVSGDRRTLPLVPVDVAGGYIQATKLDEETGEAEETYFIPIGPQRLSITIEWPLPGMVDWLSQPTTGALWEMRPEGLFGSQPNLRLDCDPWLGQQLVMFDNRGITLKDVIRVTVNTEGAHSPPLQRLSLPEGAEDKARFRVVKDRAIHILSHITVCGVRYTHAIVIETALYLFGKLIRNESIEQPKGAENIPTFGFLPSDVFSPDQDWLRFSGGLAMSLGGADQSISHSVRAPR